MPVGFALGVTGFLGSCSLSVCCPQHGDLSELKGCMGGGALAEPEPAGGWLLSDLIQLRDNRGPRLVCVLLFALLCHTGGVSRTLVCLSHSQVLSISWAVFRSSHHGCLEAAFTNFLTLKQHIEMN